MTLGTRNTWGHRAEPENAGVGVTPHPPQKLAPRL
jgi:hypothetical protein